MNFSTRPFPAENAQEIAIKALTFLAGDRDRLERFFTATGLDLQTLREQAHTRAMMAAVLEHLLGDESLLLVFCASEAIEPEDIAPAQAALVALS